MTLALVCPGPSKSMQSGCIDRAVLTGAATLTWLRLRVTDRRR